MGGGGGGSGDVIPISSGHEGFAHCHSMLSNVVTTLSWMLSKAFACLKKGNRATDFHSSQKLFGIGKVY